jgi:hypothetical protein
MFTNDPHQVLAKTLQMEKQRRYTRRHWGDARTTRPSRRD